MINKKFIQKLKKEYDDNNSERRQIISLANIVLHDSKRVIFSLHRGDEKKAKESRQRFEKTFSLREIPDDIPVFLYKKNNAPSLYDVLVRNKMVGSRNEARRLLRKGAIKFNGGPIETEDWSLQPGVLKVGKRRFLRLVCEDAS